MMNKMTSNQCINIYSSIFFAKSNSPSFFLLITICIIILLSTIIIIRMVKVYYSYAFQQPVGLISSRISNFAIDHKNKIIVSSSSQYVVILSQKSGEVLHYLHKEGKNIPIRHIKLSATKIYAAFEDGEIVVWDLHSKEIVSSLDLHKSTVASIALSEDEVRMISGGFDGHIIIWDMLSEQHQIIKSAHSNAITQVEYLNVIYKGKPTNVIVSIAKDGFLKVWDAQTRLCISVISTQTTEAVSMAYNQERSIIYVGTNKEDLLMVKINEHSDKDMCEVVGTFKRKNYTRCTQISIEYNKMFILTDKKMEIYELLSEQKLKLKKKRVVSRRKNKNEEGEAEEQSIAINEYQLHLAPLQEKPLLFKVYNYQIHDGKIFLNNGSDIILLDQSKQITNSNDRTQQLELQYPFLIQRNNRDLQVYNYGNFNHLFTIPQKVVHCSLFNSGFLMVVEEETVAIWDLAKNEKIFQLEEKWLGCWTRKNKCLLWRENELGLFQVGADAKGRTKMRQTGNKYFQDKISSAMYRHAFDKYAVNLQNSQIHIQYSDTNKNCLKLYGHKLPINSFDISSDDALLVSGSVDKDIRFWDLDFGHSIKTIFAHAEPVTAVKFLNETHYVITGSKDGHIKFWDGDTHQLIMDFQENILEIRSLAVTTAGDYIIAGGLDGGFRIWKQTNDQTIAGDQEEKNMDKVMIEQYANEKFKDREIKTRYEDLKHGEEIIEALEQNQQPAFLLKLLKKISPANLKSTLSFLHASHVNKLETYLRFMVQSKYEIELCWRVIEALDKSSTLGQELRKQWQDFSKVLRINRESLKILLKTIREERQFRI